MRERTELSVLALRIGVQERGAVLCLVLVRVVELFHSVVGFFTVISIRTFTISSSLICERTFFRLVEAKRPSSFLFEIVVVRTFFVVVVISSSFVLDLHLARIDFEKIQV